MFDMEILSEDMPDNYFSDLESTSEYYEAVMLAVEFGVVDIEAGVEATYIRTAADVASAVQTYGISVEKDSVIATKDIEVGDGIEASIVVNLSDLALEHNIQTLKGNYYVAVTGTSTITGDVTVDMIEALGGSKNVVIGTVRVMGIGEVTVSVDLQLDGQVIVTYTGDFESGVQYKRGYLGNNRSCGKFCVPYLWRWKNSE